MPSPQNPYDCAPFFAGYGIYSRDARAQLTADELIITVKGAVVQRIPADTLESDELLNLGDVLNHQDAET
ncbi:hypothetical protein [Glycomyces sp. NPDC021274]|uniref:hypothetical protein n=1 Tax=Glycomyces sp. NPDC021274 TaxID=3155120 RepID=UPI0033FA91C9